MAQYRIRICPRYHENGAFHDVAGAASTFVATGADGHGGRYDATMALFARIVGRPHALYFHPASDSGGAVYRGDGFTQYYSIRVTPA